MAILLPCLPLDVLYLIFDHFVVDPQAGPPWITQHRQKQGDLRRFSLVCRQLKSVVTPLLWRHLLVERSKHCAALFHTLLYTPSLREHAYSFACYLTIGEESYTSNSDETDTHERFSSCQRRIANATRRHSPVCLDERAKEVLRRARINYDEASGLVHPASDFATRAVASILLLLPSLEDVSVMLPWWYHGLELRLRSAEILHESIGGQPPSWGPALGSLCTLRLQCGRPYNGVGSYGGGFQPGFVQQLFMAPNVRSIEFHGDVGFFKHRYLSGSTEMQPLPEELMSKFGQIECLRLSRSKASPGTIKLLLNKCTSLTSLSWTSTELACQFTNVSGIEEASLDETLAQVSKTRRHLHLDIRHKRRSGVEYVRSLSEFPRLERLVIDLASLTGAPTILE
ncbi:hypothetical protein F5X99DRAFT_425654 [Biscogniauxia marginata]|nr:hypothetical protein F5X99DRAFT_425654 [Biscogniauxia marginata]